MTVSQEPWDTKLVDHLEQLTIDAQQPRRDTLVREVTQSVQRYGFALLSGLGAENDRETAASELIALTSALGTVIPQSPRGEEVEDVRDASDREEKDDRGYRSRGELSPHSDPPTLIALHCLKPAKSGGESFLVNVRAIHDRIAQTDPHLLDTLFQDFPQMRVAGQGGDAKIGPAKEGRSVLTKRADAISCVYYRPFIEKGAEALGTPLSADQIAALDLFDECANAPDLALRFLLQPGQTMILHNRSVLHARTDYEDWPDFEDRRHLLRVWVDAPTLFPVAPEHELGDLFAKL